MASIDAQAKGSTYSKGGYWRLYHLFKKLKASDRATGDQDSIPPILYDCVAWFNENNSIGEEGLFRIPGPTLIVKKIKLRYDRRKRVDLREIDDPHTVAALIKLYFRELLEPIMTFELYQPLILAVCTILSMNGATRLDTICANSTPLANQPLKVSLRYLREVLVTLPPANSQILLFLVEFLKKVAQQSQQNRMSSMNLAIIFGPNLIRPRNETYTTMLEDLPAVNLACYFLIQYFDILFSAPKDFDRLIKAIPETDVIPNIGAKVSGVDQMLGQNANNADLIAKAEAGQSKPTVVTDGSQPEKTVQFKSSPASSTPAPPQYQPVDPAQKTLQRNLSQQDPTGLDAVLPANVKASETAEQAIPTATDQDGIRRTHAIIDQLKSQLELLEDSETSDDGDDVEENQDIGQLIETVVLHERNAVERTGSSVDDGHRDPSLLTPEDVARDVQRSSSLGSLPKSQQETCPATVSEDLDVPNSATSPLHDAQFNQNLKRSRLALATRLLCETDLDLDASEYNTMSREERKKAVRRLKRHISTLKQHRKTWVFQNPFPDVEEKEPLGGPAHINSSTSFTISMPTENVSPPGDGAQTPRPLDEKTETMAIERALNSIVEGNPNEFDNFLKLIKQKKVNRRRSKAKMSDMIRSAASHL